MRKQQGVTVVEIAMLLVVLAIVAVVAIPQFDATQDQRRAHQNSESSAKVKSAFALAIAQKGDFPTLTEMVEYIDADFASEMSDLSGVIFRDQRQHLTINTYNDAQCKMLTSLKEPGVSDIVRCIQSYN